jgi:hypothetical protein
MGWWKAAMAAAFGGAASPQHLEQLVVELEVVEAAPPTLLLRVRNPGPSAARFCRWHTPLEGSASRFLEVRGPDGVELRYQGVMRKRGAPTAKDFVALAPGAIAEARFALGADHGPLPPGPLTVRFVGTPGVNGLPDSAVVVIP